LILTDGSGVVKAEFSSHGTSFELDAVGVVNEAIQDGIGEGGVGDVVMPVIDGELAGHEGGAGAVSFLDDFEKGRGRWGSGRC
jgi:hypothetical protein